MALTSQRPKQSWVVLNNITSLSEKENHFADVYVPEFISLRTQANSLVTTISNSKRRMVFSPQGKKSLCKTKVAHRALWHSTFHKLSIFGHSFFVRQFGVTNRLPSSARKWRGSEQLASLIVSSRSYLNCWDQLFSNGARGPRVGRAYNFTVWSRFTHLKLKISPKARSCRDHSWSNSLPFSDKDRRTDRRRNTARPWFDHRWGCAVFFFFVWSSCQFFYLCRRKRKI